MFKWRLLTGGCSLALLCWGVVAFREYSQSVGGGETGAYTSGWVYSSLGVAGLATLRWSRLGYFAALADLVVALHAVWWCVVAFSLWRTAAVTNLGFIAPLVLPIAVTTLLLCGANAVGTWQVARRTTPLTCPALKAGPGR